MTAFPMDEYNRLLLNNIFPKDWKNPPPAKVYDLVVIGGGPGGMTAATVALQKKARVAIVEKAHFGGECLNVGCIPSKALLRSSRLAAEIRDAAEMGMRVPEGWSVDFAAVMRRMRKTRSEISAFDRLQHFTQLGADIFLGTARFAGPNTLEVEGRVLHFKKTLIATGTEPVVLDVPGIKKAGYLTNQTVFNLTALPKRLAVIGAGPISCELAQAFARFGSHVTLIARGERLLPKGDTTASDALRAHFEKEGMQLLFSSHVQRCETRGSEKILYLDTYPKGISVDEMLIAIGRRPAVEDLELDKAHVRFDTKTGILTNDALQTHNPCIFVIDVSPRYNFTHVSMELAKMAVHNALFEGKTLRTSLIIPRCTFTDPEIAEVGLNEKEAKEQGIAVQTVTQYLADNVRAILDGETMGFVKIHLKQGTDQILGATIMARHAGEMISEISVAMSAQKGLAAIAEAIHPFPTQAEILRSVAEAGLKTVTKAVKPSKKAAA